MITLNVIEDVISGSYGDKNFSVTYSKELYADMLTLKDAADDVVSMEEYKEILSDFALLAVEDYTNTFT